LSRGRVGKSSRIDRGSRAVAERSQQVDRAKRIRFIERDDEIDIAR